MGVQVLANFKRWLRAHGNRHPVELQVADLVLMLWVLGWIGMVVAATLHEPVALLGCGGLAMTPRGYVALRRSLHRRRVLRCDWIEIARR